METMSFSAINKPRALKETIRLVINPRDGGLSPSRILTLADSYCINPECTCETAVIEVSEPSTGAPAAVPKTHGPGAEQRGQATDSGGDPVRLELNLADGAVVFPKKYRANAREKEILTQVAGALTKDHLSTLRRHYTEAKDWGSGRYWKYADWSRLEEGVCVYWSEVFPRTEAWIFKEGNTRYLAEDSYCVEPLCGCADAHFSIYKIPPVPLSKRLLNAIARLFGRPPAYPRLAAALVGDVTYDVKTGKLAIDGIESGEPGQLLEIAAGLFEAVDGLPSELRRRRGFMRDFGRHVAEQKRLKTAPARNPLTPGRNAPCPCGSGKKYKKCCRGKEED